MPLLLVAMPGAPSSFLFLVVRPGAPRSFMLLLVRHLLLLAWHLFLVASGHADEYRENLFVIQVHRLGKCPELDQRLQRRHI